MMKSRSWKAFYPIPSAAKLDEPTLDPLWLASRGIEPEAPALLRILRTVVSSTVNWHSVVGYHFLIHDRQSGVPCPENDHRAYVDLSLWFDNKIDAKKYLVDKGFMFVRPRGEDLPKQIAGVEGDAEQAVYIINAQSALFMRILDRYKDEKDELKVLQQMRQFMHYFSNMAQMRIQ